MTTLKSYLPAAITLLAIGGGLGLVFQGRARAQAEDCLNVALCNDRRTPIQQTFTATTTNLQLTMPVPLTIPPGKVAVIEYAALEDSTNTSAYRTKSAYLQLTRGGVRHKFPITPILSGGISVSDRVGTVLYYGQGPLLMFVQPGDQLTLFSQNDGSPLPVRHTRSLTLTGYLRDP